VGAAWSSLKRGATNSSGLPTRSRRAGKSAASIGTGLIASSVLGSPISFVFQFSARLTCTTPATKSTSFPTKLDQFFRTKPKVCGARVKVASFERHSIARHQRCERMLGIHLTEEEHALVKALAEHEGESIAVPLAAVTRVDLLGVRDSLDEASASGRLRPKTAINVWSCVRTVFRVACSTKGWAKALRVLDTDPTIGIEAVDDGPSRKRQWVYPKECSSVGGCVRRRRSSRPDRVGFHNCEPAIVEHEQLAHLEPRASNLAGHRLHACRFERVRNHLALHRGG
jgi:hypothetical protein